jgi:hypothetical protein
VNPFDQLPGLLAHERQPQGRVITAAVGVDETRMGLSRQAAHERYLADMARMHGLTIREYRAMRRRGQK